MEENNEVEHKIGNWSAIILILIAILADTASLIPFVGDFVAPIFWIGTGIYFWYSGMGIINGRKLASGAISMVAELIPMVQGLPTMIVGTVAIIIMTRIEEKTGISIPKNIIKKTPGTIPPRIQRIPLNSEEGIRPPRISE